MCRSSLPAACKPQVARVTKVPAGHRGTVRIACPSNRIQAATPKRSEEIAYQCLLEALRPKLKIGPRVICNPVVTASEHHWSQPHVKTQPRRDSAPPEIQACHVTQVTSTPQWGGRTAPCSVTATVCSHWAPYPSIEVLTTSASNTNPSLCLSSPHTQDPSWK